MTRLTSHFSFFIQTHNHTQHSTPDFAKASSSKAQHLSGLLFTFFITPNIQHPTSLKLRRAKPNIFYRIPAKALIVDTSTDQEYFFLSVRR
jgi:hypothetical protein